jgi:acetylornithine deacetylase/succinyl-diaminopimelate desuccinylase-like protein
LRQHLETNAPFGAKLNFGDIELGQAYLVDSSGWGAKLMQQSLESAYGVPSVKMGIGGSIPFIAVLKELYPNAQILVTGVEDPDSRAHSPNESLHLETLKNATLAQAVFLAAANQITK